MEVTLKYSKYNPDRTWDSRPWVKEALGAPAGTWMIDTDSEALARIRATPTYPITCRSHVERSKVRTFRPELKFIQRTVFDTIADFTEEDGWFNESGFRLAMAQQGRTLEEINELCQLAK